MKSCVRTTFMQGFSLSLAALAISSGLMTAPAAAGGSDAALGLLGGLAVGTVVGSAIAQPRYYVPYYYPPPPVVYAPPPRCWFENRRVWDGYGYIIEPVRVCG